MTQYAYVITGSWSRRTGSLTTNTMSGTFDIDPDKPAITYRQAYEKISRSFAEARGLAPDEFAVLFFSLNRNDPL
jgi:hypothetical protein